MNEDGKFVRETWNFNCDFPDKARLVSLLTGTIDFSREKALAAAAAFTRERLEEIRQLREEIEWVNYNAAKERDGMVIFPRPKRILSRLESVLKEKLRGMKEGAQ